MTVRKHIQEAWIFQKGLENGSMYEVKNTHISALSRNSEYSMIDTKKLDIWFSCEFIPDKTFNEELIW